MSIENVLWGVPRISGKTKIHDCVAAERGCDEII
jgi:hypothetical protein